MPEAPWDSLPTPDMARDIEAATQWLSGELAHRTDVTGVYLGLDTLNMDEGEGRNVEIGMTPECDAGKDEMDWVYAGNLRYGEGHLINGLYELQREYSGEPWEEAFSLCDYILFLGYSGIVLSQALMRLPSLSTFLVVWGFHDGDLLALGRKSDSAFTLICK